MYVPAMRQASSKASFAEKSAGQGCGLSKCPTLHAGKTIPLELMAAGAFDPLYRTHLDVNSGELPVLPLSIYGAVAMSHAPDTPDDDSAASQFFLYKFVRQNSGLAGLSFDEGQFAVCGYVTGVRSPTGKDAVLRTCFEGWPGTFACISAARGCSSFWLLLPRWGRSFPNFRTLHCAWVDGSGQRICLAVV